MAAIGNASRKGVLIKGGIYLEELARVDTLAVDKTGTPTEGRPKVVELHPAPGQSEGSLLSAVTAVEQRSEHPLARAVIARAAEDGVTTPVASDFAALVGAGASAQVDGMTVIIGSPTLMSAEHGVLDGLGEHAERMEHAGQTAVVVARDGRAVGVLGIADVVRAQARDAVRDLHGLGVRRIVMLTGDNRAPRRPWPTRSASMRCARRSSRRLSVACSRAGS